MTLRLSVVSEHGIRLGSHATKLFGVHGGSIGRGSDNAWILPDPERYLSGKHARIDFRKGSYVLVDTSSNGTYVNGAQVPLGKYHDYTLKDGDYVRLGEYELLVTIEANNDFPPDEDAIVTYDGRAPLTTVTQATANDLGAELDLSVLLEAGTHGDSTIQARNSYGQFVRPDWDKPPAADPPRGTQTGSFSTGSFSTGTLPPGADVAPIPISHTGTFRNPALRPAPPAAVPDPQVAAAEPAAPWHMMTRPLRLDPRSASAETATAATPDYAGAPVARAFAPSATGSAAAPLARSVVPLIDGDLEVGLAAFCRGAGIDPRTIGAEARANALQLAGQLLRESLSGLLDLTQAQGELRGRFRIPTPQDERYDSPLNFSRGVEEALVRLISNPSIRASSVDAIRENFKDLKAQSAASVTAMRAAFEAFVERLDPTTLEERFEGAAKRGVFGTPNKAKYWEMYVEMFPGLAQRSADGFPHVFSEAFAKHFEIIHRSLNPPRRSAFGADRHDPAEPGDKVVGDY